MTRSRYHAQSAPSPRSLVLASTSRASDAGYLALADLSEIAAEMRVEYRIVGGHMVTLLVAAHGVSTEVPMRETADADFAALPDVVADPRLPAALRARRYASREASNRFIRDHHDEHGNLPLVVDILAPSYQGMLVANQQHGELVVDEIPGLTLALNRLPTVVDLQVRLTKGESLKMPLALPDLAAALCIKALAYKGRFADKDAVDVWRLINAAYAAGQRAESWPTSVTGRAAAHVLHRFFGWPGAAGLRQMSARPGDQARMRALVRAVVAVP